MKQLFSELPRLSDGRITLRALTKDDAAGLQTVKDALKGHPMLPTFLFEQ